MVESVSIVTLHPEEKESIGVQSKALQGYLTYKTRAPLRSYRRPMPEIIVIVGSQGVGRFLMSEVLPYRFRHARLAPRREAETQEPNGPWGNTPLTV